MPGMFTVSSLSLVSGNISFPTEYNGLETEIPLKHSRRIEEIVQKMKKTSEHGMVTLRKRDGM